MQCPIDGTQLVIADRSGVEIDYCPQCRGVWLDRGELDKIIERSGAHMAPPPPPQAQQRYADEDEYYDDRSDRRSHKKKKRKGGAADFLGELFDF